MCPLIVALSAFILPNVNFANMIQPIIIGLVLAVVGTMMEYLFLKEGTVWLSTFLDFVAATVVVYILGLWMEGAVVTFLGALLVGIFLGISEHFTHLFLVRANKTQKSYQ